MMTDKPITAPELKPDEAEEAGAFGDQMEDFDESYYVASQWQLMRRKFFRHKLAVGAMFVLGVFYLVAIFAEFFAPCTSAQRFEKRTYCPAQRIHVISKDGIHLPFVYGIKTVSDAKAFQRKYYEDRSVRHSIRLFVRGEEYKMWGLFKTNIHLFGSANGELFLLGTDKLGRDIFSRIIYGGRVSLSIGLVGVSFAFVLGCFFGGISGYYGGKIDLVIQRVIEFILSIPTIPLWMALSAALPADWPPLKVYFGITIILSMIGWCGLARVVRGKLLQMREQDFTMAARLVGARDRWIIVRHLLPGFMSYLIVHVTLAIPHMILAETSLSFLGLGLRAPVVSWGTLLQDSQSLSAVATNPWLLFPGLFVIIAVLSFNFLGDGLRDAADPYK